MSTDQLRDQLQSSLGNAFSLSQELEPGAMARIFLAHERRLGRDVAVKVLSPQLAGGLNVERFAREIRVAAQLQEPHIVPLLAAGETADGLPYYTMPYVAGQSLRKRLADGPLAREEALKILGDIARALAHAHERGVVHRDIKPANVLLSSGTAVVTDFGIAKALTASRIRAEEHDAEELAGADPYLTAAPRDDMSKLYAAGRTMTGTGASLGTPAYMAPEQSIGDAVGPSADIYSWGVIAYELLAGVHPFADCTTAQQLLAAHLSAVPVPLSQKVRHVPRELAALVTRCMETFRCRDVPRSPAGGLASCALAAGRLLGCTWTCKWPRVITHHGSEAVSPSAKMGHCVPAGDESISASPARRLRGAVIPSICC